MAENTREIILDALLEMERGRDYSHRLVKAVLDKYDYLHPQGKAFMKRILEGTIERKIELDYVLDRFSSVPVRKMKPLIRCLTRMSVYQILHMDSVPDSAACNEAVKLAVKRGFKNLKGFVNGVLRSVASGKDKVVWPDEEKEPLKALSVRYSMPEWIVSMWLDEYGREITAKLLKGLLEIHPVSIRFRSSLDKSARQEYIAQMEKAGVKVTPSPYLPCAYLLDHVEGVAALAGYEEGVFTVQDISSMLAVEAAGIRPGDTVMDICAAPGGKSLLAAEKAALVLAGDVSESKLERMEENRARMRAGNLRLTRWDGCVFDESRKETADVLLLDVPCSGLGVMGKKRDIKYNVTQESLKSVEELQKQIVENSWQYVKPGGILLYSTCTVRREENQEMCRYICGNFPFEPEDVSIYLPQRLLEQIKVLNKAMEGRKCVRQERAAGDGTAQPAGLDWAAGVQLMPGYMETDGFYFARLRRKS